MINVLTYFTNVESLSIIDTRKKLFTDLPENVIHFLLNRNRISDRGIIAWALLVRAFEDIGIRIGDEKIMVNGGGKPFFVDSDYYFSLSHSYDRVICSIADQEVGCDVQKVIDNDYRIVRRFFHPYEYEKIQSIDNVEEKKQTFYRYWVLKESFLKATGKGLSTSLDSFYFDLDNITTIKQTKDNKTYNFREYNIGDDYHYAVCSTNTCFSESMARIDF